MAQETDASYKLLFSHPELVRDLVRGFIPDRWLRQLDFSTLQKVPCSFVTDDLRQRLSDVVWRVRADSQWVYLYLLIEFQSTAPYFMAVRIANYVSLLYQDLVNGKEVQPNQQLPPVLPIVIYTGKRRWAVPTDLSEMIPVMRGRAARYRLQSAFKLIEQSRYPRSKLARMRNLFAAVVQMEHCPAPETLPKLVKAVSQWIGNNTDLQRTFTSWACAAIRRNNPGLAIPHLETLEDLQMEMSEGWVRWAERLEQKGLEKGERKFLLKVLTQRFGAVPDEIRERIETADEKQLDRWMEQAFQIDSPYELANS
ncbi:Rpn family recombination-promoting nuclease/putative transposase [Cupriavidus sp. AU9028]|uniref:Rpn family recombination-promoting nuclease/putative transposase n=1 Tax=Cupriavidus sp. AU9028 TaxID=2871157 RepID=UPI001C98E070|nr:Rpn family recombination-promoting nuclease/putative transposase [Cupriavidus sp. AU9028]MBY4896596.1 Rpn family recombination-promoting nuclease/putative transposase [Cupriavidus sp. AU9028]